MGVEGLGALDDDFGELGVEVLEDLLGESGADVADRFVRIGEGVVAGEKEGAVDRCTLALAVVRSQNDEIKRVAYA